MTSSPKRRLKQILASIPFAAEAYWRIFDRRGPTLNFTHNNSLERLQAILPEWRADAIEARQHSSLGVEVTIFATFRYWIEHATLLGLALAGLGHRVTLIHLPYARYKIPANRFDLLRQNAYVEHVLRGMAPLLEVASLLKIKPDPQPLPQTLMDPIQEISVLDTQYSLRVEDVDRESDLYQLRLARNEFAARVALTWFKEHRPGLMIIPNGSILEYAIVYHVARHLGQPLITYEFDEPQERIRLAIDSEVMRENTGEFWEARRNWEFTEEQHDRVLSLLGARQQGSLWENYPLQFQGLPQQGEERVRAELGLDARPVVLLAPNVFGDSATLGRQVFSHSMTEWLERTVRYFASRPDIQLLIRIHPSEARFPYGTMMADVVKQALPELTEHIHLIPAEALVNTYDLVEVADLGLVYTTTLGLEMAMSGLPVVVTGFTHYRGKGFTLDPNSWDSYIQILDRALEKPGKLGLSEGQITDAWHYAYRFFFEFTLPFPWHLLYFWDDVDRWPLERVLSGEGRNRFGNAFGVLTGAPLDWSTP